jgi:hypothetical protein
LKERERKLVKAVKNLLFGNEVILDVYASEKALRGLIKELEQTNE